MENLVFTGGRGAGKSRAARAVTRIYHDLGILTYGHLEEVAAATLVGSTSEETGTLLGQAVTWAGGGVLMITGVHAWRELTDRGQQMLARLYRELTSAHHQWGDKLVVILAGQKDPVGELLDASPPLAARFPLVIESPATPPASSLRFSSPSRARPDSPSPLTPLAKPPPPLP